jgi:hypothetical protein
VPAVSSKRRVSRPESSAEAIGTRSPGRQWAVAGGHRWADPVGRRQSASTVVARLNRDAVNGDRSTSSARLAAALRAHGSEQYPTELASSVEKGRSPATNVDCPVCPLPRRLEVHGPSAVLVHRRDDEGTPTQRGSACSWDHLGISRLLTRSDRSVIPRGSFRNDPRTCTDALGQKSSSARLQWNVGERRTTEKWS